MTITFHIARFLRFLSLFATLVSNAVIAANSQLDLTESERKKERGPAGPLELSVGKI
jgi:hypothetical protein